MAATDAFDFYFDAGPGLHRQSELISTIERTSNLKLAAQVKGTRCGRSLKPACSIELTANLKNIKKHGWQEKAEQVRNLFVHGLTKKSCSV